MAAKYGYRHQQLRKRWKLQVERGNVSCARCGRLIDPSHEWDLGHLDDDPTLYAGPEHRHARDCPKGGNRATLTHARQSSKTDENSFDDVPEKGVFWGPPDHRGNHLRWSRAWFEWRDREKVLAEREANEHQRHERRMPG
jgi:hypothetical protein